MQLLTRWDYAIIAAYLAGVMLLGLLFSLWQWQHSESVVSERTGRILATITAPFSIFFILGILAPRATSASALIGAVCSIVFVLLFNGFFLLFDPVITGINWMWIAGLATLVGLTTGYLSSLFFAPKPRSALDGLTLYRR